MFGRWYESNKINQNKCLRSIVLSEKNGRNWTNDEKQPFYSEFFSTDKNR